MAKKINIALIISGKISPSLRKAFLATEEQTAELNRAFETTARVGIKAFNAVATSVAAIGTGILAASNATRDYRKDLAKMYNNAEMAGVAQKDAWSGLEDLYAMSGEFDSANEAMSNLLATGYKGEDLVKIIEAVNGATVKWQDTISQEGLADSINETVMSGKSTGQFDEILARSGVNLDRFNDGLLNCTGLAERQQYVLSWLAKSGLTEVNAQYQEQNANLVEAYEADLRYQDSLAKVGDAADGATTIMKNFAAGALSYVATKLETIDLEALSNGLKRAGELGKQAFDTIWNALSKIDWETVINAGVTILSIFTNIANFVVNNWSLISPIIYGIVGAMAAYKAILVASKVATVVSTIANAIYLAGLDLMTGGTKKQALATAAATLTQNGLNLAFLACPITWIVVGIAAIIAIIVLLVKNIDKVKEVWNKVWNACVIAWNMFEKKISAGIDWVSEKIQGLINWFSNIGGWFTNLFGGGKKSINVQVNGEKVEAAQNAIGSTITSPTLTWVGEGGDVETIVPHNNKPRSQALAMEAVKGTGLNVGGNTFVFSPNITVSGGTTNANEIKGLLDDAMKEFEARMTEWENNRRRLAF